MKPKAKSKATPSPILCNPIHVALPNTASEKMTAIVNLSQAVVELARAINSVNVQVSITNNVVTNTVGPAISVKTQP
jgi:hypothetical protein